jgi:hypothetical protein
MRPYLFDVCQVWFSVGCLNILSIVSKKPYKYVEMALLTRGVDCTFKTVPAPGSIRACGSR